MDKMHSTVDITKAYEMYTNNITQKEVECNTTIDKLDIESIYNNLESIGISNEIISSDGITITLNGVDLGIPFPLSLSVELQDMFNNEYDTTGSISDAYCKVFNILYDSIVSSVTYSITNSVMLSYEGGDW